MLERLCRSHLMKTKKKRFWNGQQRGSWCDTKVCDWHMQESRTSGGAGFSVDDRHVNISCSAERAKGC